MSATEPESNKIAERCRAPSQKVELFRDGLHGQYCGHSRLEGINNVWLLTAINQVPKAAHHKTSDRSKQERIPSWEPLKEENLSITLNQDSDGVHHQQSRVIRTDLLGL